jgi:NADPH-dependent ferric siderophore reductase
MEAMTTVPIRREPPRFRVVAVRRVEQLSPRMTRVVLAGPELEGLAVDEPAASVRVLLPSPETGELVIPTWNGNEFLMAVGARPPLRTLTPRRFDSDTQELTVDVVMHGDGLATQWAAVAAPRSPAAISGPGRGYAIDADAPGFLLAGDESAIPAMSQLLEHLPVETPVTVLIEVADPGARLPVPHHASATVEWLDLAAGAAPGDAMVDAVRAAALVPDSRIWIAGEAACMQRIRRYLFAERGLPRSLAVVRGYWK